MTIRSDRPYARRANRGPDASGEPGKRKKNWINYPRAKSRIRWMRWLPSLRLMLLTGFLLTSAVVATIAVMYARTPLPGIADITKSEVSVVYWADGTEMMRFEEQNRVILPNDKIPPVMKDATVASEDRTFWSNQGISLKGIARAAYNNARGRPLQGGSTLTQQYVKNVLLNTQARTRERKVKEFFIAVKIARKMDKNEILGQYLNTIYFGRNCYGVEAASQCYFGHPAAKLTVSEAAFLAGIINGPELYDPYDGPVSKQRAIGRWNHTLGAMVETGKLTQADRDKLVFPKVIAVKVNVKNAGQIGYFRNTIRNSAKSLVVDGDKITDRDLDTGGLRIHTTLDRHLVDTAVRIQAEDLPGKGRRPQLGVTVIDPSSGAVRVILGGTGFTVQNQYNQSTQTTGQLASTAKIFCLVAALEQKISLKSQFEAMPKYYFPNDKRAVTNSKGESAGGNVDLLDATAHSINTVFAQLNQRVTWRATADVMVRAGLPRDKVFDGQNENLRNVLGTNSATTLQLATAYATFAAQGVHHDAYFIQSIDASNGRNLYKHQDSGRRVFAADVMADATYAMQQVVQRGTGTRVRALGRPAAGKTGTSTENVSAWFAGFTPQLTTVVRLVDWEPDDKGKPHAETVKVEGKEQNGGNYPAQLWTLLMKEALGDSKVVPFPEPAWVGEEAKPTGTLTGTPTGTASVTSTPTASVIITPTDTPSESPTDGPTPTEEPTTAKPSPSDTPRPTTSRAKPTSAKPTPTGSPTG